MKTHVYIILILSSVSLSSIAQQLPNGGFENWSSKSITDPLGFFTSNQMLTPGSGNVTRVTTAWHGQYAIKLETVKSGNDTIQGMITVGQPGNQGINGGLPFSGSPDSISGYAYFNIQPKDTASFIVAFKKNGTYISRVIRQFTGQQSTYHRFCMPTYLNPANPPDSLVALITSSRMNPPRQPGSWLVLDSITFLHSMGQFPNSDFENWSTLTGPEDPDGWGTNAGQFPSYQLPVLVTKTTDAHSGLYGAKLISDTGYVQPPFGRGIYGDTIAGLLQLNLVNGFKSSKYPFAYRPDSLLGYVKGVVASGSGNMNLIWLQLSHQGTVVGQGVYMMTSTIAGYTRIASSIGYTSTLMPDSLQFSLFASNPQKYFPGNEFYVDDLSFVYNSSTGLNNPEVSGIKVYPQSVSRQLFIEIPANETDCVHLYDMTGNLTGQYPAQKRLNQIDCSEMPPGMYLYRITANGKLLKAGKFIKE